MHAGNRALAPIVVLALAGLSWADSFASPGILRNRGEYPPEVLCSGSVGAATVFITTNGLVWDLHSPLPAPTAINDERPRAGSQRRVGRQAIRIKLLDGVSLTSVTPLDSLPLVVNRYRGHSPDHWCIGEHPWTSVRLGGPQSADAIVLRVAGDSLLIEPSNDPEPGGERLVLQVEGDVSTSKLGNGGRAIRTALGPVSIEPHGKRGWCLTDDQGAAKASRPGAAGQAASRANILWSTYLGGNDYDVTRAMALDGGQNPVVFGETYSMDFPVTPGAFDSTTVGSAGFLARLDGRTGRPFWVTYLGGSRTSEFFGLAISSRQQAIVSGWTESPDYPTTPGAYDESLDAGWAAVITSMDLDSGQLVWSTFLERCYGWSIALTSDDCPVVAGSTTSALFVTTPGAFDRDLNGPAGVQDGTISKLSADGSGLLWSTYLGSPIIEKNMAVAVDAQDRPVVAGVIYALPGETADDFPVTPGSYDVTFNGEQDYYIATLSKDGTNLVWCTFLGGPELDIPEALTLDSSGDVAVLGYTKSVAFPVTTGAYEWTADSEPCAVSRISRDGRYLLASKVFGGSFYNAGTTIGAAPNGDLVISGHTYGPNFPAAESLPPEPVIGLTDAFVVEMDSTLTDMKWFTLIGGNNLEFDNHVARSADGRLFMAGMTGNFPLTPGAYDTTQVLEEVYVACLSGPMVPVTLASFSARWESGQAVVRWRFAEEGGVTRADLYRQAESCDRVLIGEVALTGRGEYGFADAGCPSGINVQYWLREGGAPGSEGWYGPANLQPRGPGESLALSPAQPNPFNPRTIIRFSLPRPDKIALAIYDARGRLVRRLAAGEASAGSHSLEWDGRDEEGRAAPSGNYILRLKTETGIRVSRLTLAR